MEISLLKGKLMSELHQAVLDELENTDEDF